MKRALITGITGQDGAYLSRFLLENNYQVLGLITDFDQSYLDNLRLLGIVDQVKFIHGDILDLPKLTELLAFAKVDEIYHLAAQSSVASSFDHPVDTVTFNVLSTHHLLEAMRVSKLSARFYHASSSEMYGRVKKLPVVEDSVFHPVSPYAISKAAGHWLAMNYREAYSMFCCCGILFNHESFLRPPHYVTKKIISTAVRISKGSMEKLSLGNMEIQRDWGYAPAYIESMWLMLQQDKPDEYVIATNEAHSLKEFVEKTFRYFNLHWEEHTIIDEKFFRPSDIDIIYGDPSKAKSRLGWVYNLTFEQLIHRLVEDELAFQRS